MTKEQKAQYFKNYYKINKEKIEAKKKIWNDNHKAERKEYQKEYHKLYRFKDVYLLINNKRNEQAG